MSLFLKEEVTISGHQLIVKERIAEGGFGFVDLVCNPQTGQEFVLKRCGIQRQENYDTVNKEITLLRRFKDVHIVHLIASETVTNGGKREALILLEYCPGGHLLTKLNARQGSPLALSEICRIFGQLLRAVQPLHASSPPVVHRDLKLENVLFSLDGSVKLCDFGSCVMGYVPVRTPEEKSKAEEVISKETTQMYRAPEMVDLYIRDELTEKTDIWALGCILYCLCFITHPFQDAGNLGILSAKISMPHNTSIPEDMKILIMRLLDMEPEARPSVPQIAEAINAILTGAPLPPYELSDIAKQRKQERIDAQNRRAQLQKKKTPNVLPTREHVPLAANSVAARRLAAKRAGGGGITEVAGAIPHPGYASKPSTAPTSSAREGGSDMFFSTESSEPAPIRPAAPSTSDGLDLFDSSPASSQAMPSQSATASSASFFDDFATPATNASSQSSADPFTSNDFFSAASTAPQSKAPAPSAEFDAFGDSAPVASTGSTSGTGSGGFDAFGGGDLLSDMSFATAPPQSQEQKTKGVLSLFDTPQQGRVLPGQHHDPFATMGGHGGGYNQQGMYGMPQQYQQGRGMPGVGIRPQQMQQQEEDPFGSLGVLKK
mmetsp:Transcript_15865/g.23892  ORF Transcript_15865/g.23892 Transcript_15865/m.23892 type:complete len:604 (-) Transcript_15865:166-1977(-)|eukprot:CAMPEP_0185018302 /NCGR_PEP_ID=MMETSP1103-20130426/1067_1 /TAXON_ID=36769 /ORGANISM="Paraphysomonas bandaiensis, Strain Caron Lab Isolate" /LENGTH=603 /DNA_ID=CAMNT_0027548063 /DNA_START=75 /DNA_END=1886 /DNA_ORIENTATION=+